MDAKDLTDFTNVSCCTLKNARCSVYIQQKSHIPLPQSIVRVLPSKKR